MPHNINAVINKSQGLFLNGLSETRINMPPVPYIGSQGPNMVPRFTNTPSLAKWSVTSHIHPINENVKNNNIKEVILYRLSKSKPFKTFGTLNLFSIFSSG